MSEIERHLKTFEEELLNVIEKFEKEHGLLMVDVKYDGFDKSVTYTFAGEKFQIHKSSITKKREQWKKRRNANAVAGNCR